MPRQARWDAPGTLRHVMGRGLERTRLFREATDREDFLGRVTALAEAGAFTIYAWAVLPNHAHLLVQTGQRSLARSMRRLLWGRSGQQGSLNPTSIASVHREQRCDQKGYLDRPYSSGRIRLHWPAASAIAFGALGVSQGRRAAPVVTEKQGLPLKSRARLPSR